MKQDWQNIVTELQKSGDVALPQSGEYYDQLHAKIMARIPDEAPSWPSWYERPGQYLRAHWRSWWTVQGSSRGKN